MKTAKAPPASVVALRRLIRIHRESSSILEKAARFAEGSRSRVADLLRSEASHRARCAGELTDLVPVSDLETAEPSRSFQRRWSALDTAIEAGAEGAVLIAVDREARAIERAYREAIGKTAGASAGDVLQEQLNETLRFRTRIRDLRTAEFSTR